MLSLTVGYPLLAAPVLAWAADADEMPLAVKVRHWPAWTCVALVGGPSHPGTPTLSTLPSLVQVHAIALLKSAALTLAGMDATATAAPGAAPASATSSPPCPHPTLTQTHGKTTVKRPLKLAASARRAAAVRSDFGPVAPLFYYPVLRVCARAAAGRRPGTDPYLDTRLQLPADFAQLALGDGAVGGELLLRRPAAAPSAVLISEYVAPVGRPSGAGSGAGVGVGAAPPPAKSLIEEDGGDGLHSMVPAEALLALATFTACSVNTNSQRYRRCEAA